MATYVNDLRLKEIATGDESGTWGTSTNTNLELVIIKMKLLPKIDIPNHINKDDLELKLTDLGCKS